MALARRHALPRAKEPLYDLQDVPRCKKSMEGACVLRVKKREEWIEALPELLLLCDEASLRNNERARKKHELHMSRRQAEQLVELNGTSNPNANPLKETQAPVLHVNHGKPLSLEYMADRLDLDDPLRGYIVRDKPTGWIQGFITVTTFTTWQRWFRFDSLADEAGMLMFEQEGKGLEALHEMGCHVSDSQKENSVKHWWNDRLIDGDGSLAAALNLEMRDGDVNGEGVVWPRVAELSLLGGIGCGSWLLKLIIEELEQPDSPYSYLVLQATDNSVPFYESQGFVRVGAVARYTKQADEIKAESRIRKRKEAKDVPPEDTNQVPDDTPGGLSSPYKWYKVNNVETPTVSDVARKLKVRASEIIFFNRRFLLDLKSPKDRLANGVMLRIPVFPPGVDPLGNKLPKFPKPILASATRKMAAYDGQPGEISKSRLWYTALDNESPLSISTKLNISPSDLCAVNRGTYPTIHKRSPLEEGTILRLPGSRPLVPGVDDEVAKKRDSVLTKFVGIKENAVDKTLGKVICYRHWAFSDDPVELTHASYMMVRPLRKSSKRDMLNQLSKLLVRTPPPVFKYGYPLPLSCVTNATKKKDDQKEQDEYPKEIRIVVKSKAMKHCAVPMGPLYARYADSQRVAGRSHKRLLNGGDKFKVYLKNVPLKAKRDLVARLEYPLKISNTEPRKRKLFNMVVRLLPKESKVQRLAFLEHREMLGNDYGAVVEHRRQNEVRTEEDYKYFYVLTYIPDLYWARLAPMQQDGVFSSRYAKVAGRKKWVLVPEGKGQEIDVSAARCVAVQAKAVCRTKDADKEQWDVRSR